jgi:sugar/nucleoside kinase (ribokinase family)
MKKVLCIAESCCDIIFGQLNRIPVLGKEEFCRVFAVKAGGGANTPMGLARLRIPTSFLTALGDDEMGKIVLSHLIKSGLDPAMFTLKPGMRTPASAVMSTNKDRCFASFGGDGNEFVTERQIEEGIKKADHVHTYLGYCIRYPIAQLCKKYRKTLSLDTSWIEDMRLSDVKSILSACDIFTPNEEEAYALTNTDNIPDALNCLAGIVPNAIITMGDKGSASLIDGDIHLQECAYYGPAADTTGAGDLYSSGLIYGYVHGYDLKKSMEIASHTSGLCVTYYGGIDDAFTMDNIKCLQADSTWKYL